MKTEVQWWLAELGPHDLPKLLDGPHSRRSACNKAAYLIQAIRACNPDGRPRKFAVARVELSECAASSKGVNHKAVDALNQMTSELPTGQTREEGL